MTKRLIDRDPLTGKEVWFDYDQNTDHMTITHSENVKNVLDYCSNMRQISPERTRKQIKQDFVHYAVIPEAVQLEMKTKHGVDFWDKNDRAKVFSLINTEYSNFKTTNILHNIRKQNS